jgi:hypothetical protein
VRFDPVEPIDQTMTRIDPTLEMNAETVLTAEAAIEGIFALQKARIDQLERRIAALEAKPAARSIEHVRDSAGNVIRSIVLETPMP